MAVISLVLGTFVTRGCAPPPLGYADMHNSFVLGPPPLPKQKSLSLCQEARLLCDLPSPGSESCIFVQSLSFWLPIYTEGPTFALGALKGSRSWDPGWVRFSCAPKRFFVTDSVWVFCFPPPFRVHSARNCLLLIARKYVRTYISDSLPDDA